MRKSLLAVLCLVLYSSGLLLAQNKTLGVGVATPNPNAALHVESPTGNQGFILPRLTTAQRTATGFTSVLGTADNGLMVYDTDLNTIFIWNGSAWRTTGQVSGVGYFEVTDPQSPKTALVAVTNSDGGGATLPPVAIYGESNGTGATAGSFRVNNPENVLSALYAETLGSGVSIMGETSSGFSAVLGQVKGGVSNGVSGISNSPETGSFAVLGQNNGGGPAGVFSINNATNTSNALEASTGGTGPAGKFTISNTGNASAALLTETNGSGPVISANQTGTGSGIMVVKNGGGPANVAAIFSRHLGASGYAGVFQNENAANPRGALFAESVGPGESFWAQKSMATSTGDAIWGQHLGSSGRAAFFESANSSNPSPALQATVAGLAPAALFQQTNIEAWSPALVVETSGQGAAFGATSTAASNNANAAEFVVLNTANPRYAVMAETLGLGSAGNFIVNNASNSSAAVKSTTNGSGVAISADHSNFGIAIEMVNGGLKYSVLTVTSGGGTITGLAGIFKITVSGTYGLPTTVPDGTVCKVYNGSGGNVVIDPVTVQGTPTSQSVNPGAIIDFVYLDGAWHENP